jgi:hypothetical protein
VSMARAIETMLLIVVAEDRAEKCDAASLASRRNGNPTKNTTKTNQQMVFLGQPSPWQPGGPFPQENGTNSPKS